MKTTQNQQAKNLYFGTHKSQKQIADEVGISEKTLYLWIKKGAWDELKLASLAAPAIIVDNLCYMLIELQTHIGQRPVDNRFPTPQEVDSMRKLINSITKMKEYSSVGMNMQVMADFVNYLQPDEEFQHKLQLHAENYFKARKQNDRYSTHFAYGVPPPLTSEEEIEAIRQELEERFGTPAGTAHMSEKVDIENSDLQPEISNTPSGQTLPHRRFPPIDPRAEEFPAPERTGNIRGLYSWSQAGLKIPHDPYRHEEVVT